MIHIALPKGRLGESVYERFEQAGFGCPDFREKNRRLIFSNEAAGVSFFWVKPSDVAIYVERGAADIRVAGKDILLEYSPDVYELLDLGLGRCRMCVAGFRDFQDEGLRPLRVATKFPNITRKWYAAQSREIDVIGLHGSIELAPLLGLSDVIVDIVETGKTLQENGLAPLETVVEISARLIANRAAFSFQYPEITRLCNALSPKETVTRAGKATAAKVSKGTGLSESKETVSQVSKETAATGENESVPGERKEMDS